MADEQAPHAAPRPRPEEPRERGDIGEDVSRLGSGYAKYAGAGVQFAVTILVFAYVGYRVDGWLDSSPWFLIVGVFLGFLGGMLSLVAKVKKV